MINLNGYQNCLRIQTTKIYIYEGMSTYNILLYLLEHQKNRVYHQQLDKFALITTGTSPAVNSNAPNGIF